VSTGLAYICRCGANVVVHDTEAHYNSGLCYRCFGNEHETNAEVLADMEPFMRAGMELAMSDEPSPSKPSPEAGQ
jgi:hypothetical protein